MTTIVELHAHTSDGEKRGRKRPERVGRSVFSAPCRAFNEVISRSSEACVALTRANHGSASAAAAAAAAAASCGADFQLPPF